jgi:hypothetical protein
MATRFAEEELQCVSGRLDRSGDRGNDLGLGSRELDDLDPALVELAEQRVLLELRQLERLGDLRQIGCPDRPDLLRVSSTMRIWSMSIWVTRRRLRGSRTR